MVVGFGATIKDVTVFLGDGETLPNKYNTALSTIFRHSKSTDWQLVLLKGLGEVLPENDPLLANPPPDLPLTTGEAGDTIYEHDDIIQIDEDRNRNNDSDDTGARPVVPSGS
jgi:hypothetical protein